MTLCPLLSDGAVGRSLFFPDMNMKTDTPDETTLTHSLHSSVCPLQKRPMSAEAATTLICK